MGVSVHDAAHEVREGAPRVVTSRQGGLGLGYVAAQAVGAQPPKEIFFARITTVQGADPNPGALGHLGDGCFWICDEHLAGSLQEQPVIAPCLGLPAAQGSARRLRGPLLVHESSITYLEQNSPFKYNIGTLYSVPYL